MKKIFIICSVRDAPLDLRLEQEEYATRLKSEGHTVHYPPWDTDQTASGLEICRQNADAIAAADEVHIFYTTTSQGTHFDMGVAFALGKKIVIAKNVEFGPGKSYPRMLDEWSKW
jgi:nucleoside 2-deoxyribosyltransferase